MNLTKRTPKIKNPSLAKTYEPKLVEDKIYDLWLKSGFFNPDKLPGKRSKTFTVIMPPPNATGTLHMGHAMFLTIQDIIIRFERLRGKVALWLPGTDHAAIATHAKVESLVAAEGQTRFSLGREKFLKRVNEFVAASQIRIREQIRKMGSSCDWSREAYTLDDPRNVAVRACFYKMWTDGLIYRGNRIVNWCPHCESTLADDEVEYIEEKTPFYYFKYGPISIGTARPETKFLDKTIVVHPDDPRYRHLIGQVFDVPWLGGTVQANVITDREIDMNFGTGAMTITPAHDFHDFDLAQKYNLPVVKIIDEKGNFTSAAGSFAGRSARAARSEIVKLLEAQGLVERVEENYVHHVSVCYRCGTPIEPLPSRQWFIDVQRPIPGRGQTLKELSIAALTKDGIEIIPNRFEKVYFHWINNLRDWCISRQIWFGHRIPVWYCQHCFSDDGTLQRVSAAGANQKPSGIIVSTATPKKCPTCGGTDLVQDPDTLDTWFSSGMWTFSTLGWPKSTQDLKRFHPTQVLETGHDILFFWVARMILMTTYVLKEIPFEKVYLHGLVRDSLGRKMSKSLGNIIDPLDVAAKYGTDAVRLSVIVGNAPGNDLKLSEANIEHFRNFTNKLWNIARFVAMNATLRRTSSLRPTPKTLADKWILARLDQVTGLVTQNLIRLQFSAAGETLRDFTWNEFADWYLEISKVEGRKNVMLNYLLQNILLLWHPFMPFVTETIYQKFWSRDKKDLLMIKSWPKKSLTKNNSKVLKDFEVLMSVVTSIRQVRTAYALAPGKLLRVIVASKNSKMLKANQKLLRALGRLESLDIKTRATRPTNSVASVAGGLQIFVALSGVVDLTAEKIKLNQEITAIQVYLKSLEQKLKNADFIKRAPAKIVARELEKQKLAQDKLEKLSLDLKMLD